MCVYCDRPCRDAVGWLVVGWPRSSIIVAKWCLVGLLLWNTNRIPCPRNSMVPFSTIVTSTWDLGHPFGILTHFMHYYDVMFDFRVTSQVFSKQCDRLHLLITMLAGARPLWVRRASSYYYDHLFDRQILSSPGDSGGRVLFLVVFVATFASFV